MIRILVIEDDTATRENLTVLLSVEGYDVAAAANGVEGVRLARQISPHLIICDVMMPNLDGWGVLSVIRQDPTLHEIPFIFLTADTVYDDVRRGMTAGADDYIFKPFTQEQLLKAIRTRLEKFTNLVEQAQAHNRRERDDLVNRLPDRLMMPLGMVIGYSNYLRQNANKLNAQQVAERASTIYKSGTELMRILQNYLFYIDLDDNREQVRDETHELPFCDISAAAELAGAKGRQDQRMADLDIMIQDAIVNIPEHYLLKIVEELLDNAFRYSRPGTRVICRGQLDEGKKMYCLTIQDMGSGMTPDQVNDLMAPIGLVPAKNSARRLSNLGLNIVKRIVQMHRGNLEITSMVGSGTKIDVRLQLAGRRE
ncbi:MAG TPA: response regulator [Anaerolineaceae bacterium]|nr:response regulator [Anaerolineaceae bacterium]HPN50204.1 response regulator [Anaerolineaceae bacterium]